MDVVFAVCIMTRVTVDVVYGKYECFVMQMLYVCVLCASCGSSQCGILHELQLVNAGRGCKRRSYMEEAYSRACIKDAMDVFFCLPHHVYLRVYPL